MNILVSVLPRTVGEERKNNFISRELPDRCRHQQFEVELVNVKIVRRLRLRRPYPGSSLRPPAREKAGVRKGVGGKCRI